MAKVKRGAKMMAILFIGVARACARMQYGSGAEIEALTLLMLAWLELTPPPNIFIVSSTLNFQPILLDS